MSSSIFIVVVEDDDSIRKLVFDILHMSGYSAIPFSNGEEALQWMRAHPSPIDLLITDIKMPGMSGKELADQICHHRPGIKILFISGFTSFTREELNACSNFEGHFLGKPFKPAELRSQVEKIIGPKPA